MTSHAVTTRQPGLFEEKIVKSRLFCAIALSACAASGAAMAQDSADIGVNTSVPAFCSSLTPGSPTSMSLGSLVGPTGQVVSTFGGTTSYALASYYCNSRATITLAASPLRPTIPVSIGDVASFTDRVDYVASLSWDDVSLQVESAAGSPAQLTTTEANIGTLTVTVSDPETESNKRPVAATYEAAVTLTIAPQA